MGILGTKVIWKPLSGDQDASKHQILKNGGYINVILKNAQYNSIGSFWQKAFGGSDKITLSANVVFKNGTDMIEATTVQDVREVKANRTYTLGLGGTLALKVPAYCDGIELTAKMTAVKDDAFENSLNLLNSPEFQGALQFDQ